MGRSIQYVRWALEQTCGLRTGEAATAAPQAVRATGWAQLHARGVARSVFDSAEQVAIVERLQALGGAEVLMASCRACPASIDDARMAACAGWLYQDPDSEDTQGQLERIVSRLGFAGAMKEAFARTNPIWYGLWARSPLSTDATRLLRSVLGAMHDEDAALESWAPGERDKHLRSFRDFIRAAEVAEERRLKLHVTMAPPGHGDFGVHTVFAHCPLCKAGSGEGWADRETTVCHVCGTEYRPADTRSCTRDP